MIRTAPRFRKPRRSTGFSALSDVDLREDEHPRCIEGKPESGPMMIASGRNPRLLPTGTSFVTHRARTGTTTPLQCFLLRNPSSGLVLKVVRSTRRFLQ